MDNNKKIILKVTGIVVGTTLLLSALALSTVLVLSYAAQIAPTPTTPCAQSYLELIKQKAATVYIEYWADTTWEPKDGKLWTVDIKSMDKEYGFRLKNTELCAALDDAWNKLNAYDAFIEGQKK